MAAAFPVALVQLWLRMEAELRQSYRNVWPPVCVQSAGKSFLWTKHNCALRCGSAMFCAVGSDLIVTDFSCVAD